MFFNEEAFYSHFLTIFQFPLGIGVSCSRVSAHLGTFFSNSLEPLNTIGLWCLRGFQGGTYYAERLQSLWHTDNYTDWCSSGYLVRGYRRIWARFFVRPTETFVSLIGPLCGGESGAMYRYIIYTLCIIYLYIMCILSFFHIKNFENIYFL